MVFFHKLDRYSFIEWERACLVDSSHMEQLYNRETEYTLDFMKARIIFLKIVKLSKSMQIF